MLSDYNAWYFFHYSVIAWSPDPFGKPPLPFPWASRCLLQCYCPRRHFHQTTTPIPLWALQIAKIIQYQATRGLMSAVRTYFGIFSTFSQSIFNSEGCNTPHRHDGRRVWHGELGTGIDGIKEGSLEFDSRLSGCRGLISMSGHEIMSYLCWETWDWDPVVQC